jgi:uncharacterized Zn-finger protein
MSSGDFGGGESREVRLREAVQGIPVREGDGGEEQAMVAKPMWRCRECRRFGTRDELITPCFCEGVDMFVHPGCLKEAREKVFMEEKEEKAEVCPRCHTRYTIDEDHVALVSLYILRAFSYLVCMNVPFIAAYFITPDPFGEYGDGWYQIIVLFFMGIVLCAMCKMILFHKTENLPAIKRARDLEFYKTV